MAAVSPDPWALTGEFQHIAGAVLVMTSRDAAHADLSAGSIVQVFSRLTLRLGLVRLDKLVRLDDDRAYWAWTYTGVCRPMSGTTLKPTALLVTPELLAKAPKVYVYDELPKPRWGKPVSRKRRTAQVRSARTVSRETTRT